MGGPALDLATGRRAWVALRGSLGRARRRVPLWFHESGCGRPAPGAGSLSRRDDPPYRRWGGAPIALSSLSRRSRPSLPPAIATTAQKAVPLDAGAESEHPRGHGPAGPCPRHVPRRGGSERAATARAVPSSTDGDSLQDAYAVAPIIQCSSAPEGSTGSPSLPVRACPLPGGRGSGPPGRTACPEPEPAGRFPRPRGNRPGLAGKAVQPGEGLGHGGSARDAPTSAPADFRPAGGAL